MLESQFIDFICQTSLGVYTNSIKSKINNGKLRKKIQAYAKAEFERKFYYLDLSSEIDYGGLSAYLENSLTNELENYIATPNDDIKKMLITKAFNEAKADNQNKKSVVIAFIESVIIIMKQDFISNVDKGFRIFANDLKDDLFNDIKSDNLEKTNKIMEKIATLDSNDYYIIGNQAIEISQLNKISNDVNFIKSAVIQEQIERNVPISASISNPFDLLSDFGVSISADDTVSRAIKYSSRNNIMSIRFCVKREGRIAKYDTTDKYLADLNFTMVEDTVDVISSQVIQNEKKTEHICDDNYKGSVCYLPWLSFSEMEIYSSCLDKFTNSQCISSKLTIVPKQIQATYNVENGDREILWYDVRYKLLRSIENNNRCCYYENETNNSKIKINIKFTFDTIHQDGERIIINPQPNITFSIVPLDKSNARSKLEYYQALAKLYSTDILKFINVKTMETDFSFGIKVNGLSDNEIKSIIDLYKKIIDIEEYFKVEFQLENPIDSDLWNHVNMVHGLIKNKKVTVNYSSMSITTHLESNGMDIGSSYGWIAQVNMNKKLFDKELPIENVVMVCPNTKYKNKDGDSTVLEIIGKTIYFWDTKDEVYSNLHLGFDKVLDIVG